jgi:hypothetical protein
MIECQFPNFPTKKEYIAYWGTKRESLITVLERNGISYNSSHTGHQIAEIAWQHSRFFRGSEDEPNANDQTPGALPDREA